MTERIDLPANMTTLEGPSEFWRYNGLKSSDEALVEIAVVNHGDGRVTIASKDPLHAIDVPELCRSFRTIHLTCMTTDVEHARKFAQDLLKLLEAT